MFVDPLPNKSVLQLHVIEQVKFLLNIRNAAVFQAHFVYLVNHSTWFKLKIVQ